MRLIMFLRKLLSTNLGVGVLDMFYLYKDLNYFLILNFKYIWVHFGLVLAQGMVFVFKVI